MKTSMILLAAGLGLGGCAIVPAYGPPGDYGSQAYGPPRGYVVAPTPAIVVQPYFGFGGYYGHRRGGRRWR